MNNAKRWLRIPNGALEGLYQLELWTSELDPDKLPKCPCCQGELKPGYDICQWGMFEDNYRSYVICPSCVKAWELLYNVPTYAMFTKREQKRLFTSKKSSEAGSDRRER